MATHSIRHLLRAAGLLRARRIGIATSYLQALRQARRTGLRASIVDPERRPSLLESLVEIGERQLHSGPKTRRPTGKARKRSHSREQMLDPGRRRSNSGTKHPQAHPAAGRNADSVTAPLDLGHFARNRLARSPTPSRKPTAGPPATLRSPADRLMRASTAPSARRVRRAPRHMPDGSTKSSPQPQRMVSARRLPRAASPSISTGLSQMSSSFASNSAKPAIAAFRSLFRIGTNGQNPLPTAC